MVLPLPLHFLFSEFSLLFHFLHILFFSCPFLFSPSFFRPSTLGFSGLHLPIDLSPGPAGSPGCLRGLSLWPLWVSALQETSADLILAFLAVQYKGVVALSSSYLNPFALALSPG